VNKQKRKRKRKNARNYTEF